MPRGSNFTLTDGATLGLFFIQRYRFLTIDQFARAAALNRSTASDQLRVIVIVSATIPQAAIGCR
jgi:hypothetical protein